MRAKVINEWRAKEEAYSDAYYRFSQGEEVDEEDFQFSHFTESATWANTVAPNLRAMAGYDDEGYGTYQTPVPIVLVSEPDDEPAVGQLVEEPWHFLDELHQAYQRGAFDAATGRERDPPAPHEPENGEGPSGP